MSSQRNMLRRRRTATDVPAACWGIDDVQRTAGGVSSTPLHRRRAGFSLVELLVVIAIMTLLIAALLPTLQKARVAAMSVQCMSNLRQHSIAVATYAEDHDGRFPATSRWVADWMIRLRHYMGYTDRASVPTITGHAGHAHSIDRLVPAFQCPQSKDWPAPSYYNGTYGINLITVSPASHTSHDRMKFGRTRDNLMNAPSRIYLISDNYKYGTENWGEISSAANPQYSRPRHHNGGVNILFMDSHAQQLKRGDRVDLYYRDNPNRKPDGWW